MSDLEEKLKAMLGGTAGPQTQPVPKTRGEKILTELNNYATGIAADIVRAEQSQEQTDKSA
jgi:hypothetical protein